MRSLIKRLIDSASLCIFDNPIGSLSSEIPKNKVPPMPLENALTLFNQLFGFFVSSATLKSHSVASAINCSIIIVPLLSNYALFVYIILGIPRRFKLLI